MARGVTLIRSTLLTAVGCMLFWINGSAEGLAGPQSFSLNIPAEPLGDALNDLAQQSGLQILFSSGLVTGLNAPTLKGSLTFEAALRRLPHTKAAAGNKTGQPWRWPRRWPTRARSQQARYERRAQH